MGLAIGLRDRQIVDARDTQSHETRLVEFPVLVAVTAKPLAAVIVPFVGESDRDAVLAERPQLLDEAVVELAGPLAHEKGLDGVPALDELGAIAPAAVDAVGERDARRI